MRELFSDFMEIERRADGTLRLPLGAEQAIPELRGLVDGEHVLLIYPENLEAEAIVTHEQQAGWTLWYAILSGEQAIHDIHPEALANGGQIHSDEHAEAQA